MNENCPCDAVKRLQDDMDGVKEDISKLHKSEGVFETKLISMSELLNRMDTKLDRLSEKPVKRWETLVGEIIKYAVIVAFGFILIKLGLK